MCDGVSEIVAGVGAVAALAGGAVQYSASQHAASAAQAAQQQQLQSQNAAFQSRIAAQNQRTQEQAGIQDQSQAAYLAAEQKMRGQQSQALDDQATQVAKMNEQERQIQEQTQQAVQDTTQKTVTPASLQQAQQVSEQARMSGVQPTVQDIAASNPIPSGGGVKEATTSALAKSMSEAAGYTEKYGANLAKLGSYSAPMQAVDLAKTNLATQLMPAGVADQLLKAGVNARLLPSQTAYTGAGNIGAATIAANTANTAERMQLAGTRAEYTENLADLNQRDTDALIQTGLNVTQARDAATASMGGALSSVGNAAIGYGASKGAFSDLFGSGAGTDIGGGWKAAPGMVKAGYTLPTA